MMSDEEAEHVVDGLLDQLRGVVAGLVEATDNDLDRLEAVERRIFDRRRGAPDRRYLNAAVMMTNLAAQALSEA